MAIVTVRRVLLPAQSGARNTTNSCQLKTSIIKRRSLDWISLLQFIRQILDVKTCDQIVVVDVTQTGSP